jgi:hypothetical protein
VGRDVLILHGQIQVRRLILFHPLGLPERPDLAGSEEEAARANLPCGLDLYKQLELRSGSQVSYL